MKSLLIQQWFAGHYRDKIAFDSGISAGVVTNIVNEWRMGWVLMQQIHLIISSLIEDDAPSASAGSELFDVNLRQFASS